MTKLDDVDPHIPVGHAQTLVGFQTIWPHSIRAGGWTGPQPDTETSQ
jgi:hypothetical protein